MTNTICFKLFAINLPAHNNDSNSRDSKSQMELTHRILSHERQDHMKECDNVCSENQLLPAQIMQSPHGIDQRRPNGKDRGVWT